MRLRIIFDRDRQYIRLISSICFGCVLWKIEHLQRKCVVQSIKYTTLPRQGAIIALVFRFVHEKKMIIGWLWVVCGCPGHIKRLSVKLMNIIINCIQKKNGMCEGTRIIFGIFICDCSVCCICVRTSRPLFLSSNCASNAQVHATCYIKTIFYIIK